MEGRAPGLALLVGPSGNNWYVGLIIVDNGLFLNDGWADFVRDHFLEQGDSLVFRYDGNLHFTVQIFDRSLCEKEAAFSAESSQDLSKYDISTVKKREREKLALLDSIIEGVPKKMRCSQMQSEGMCKDHENNTNAINVEEWMQQADGNSSLRNAVTVALPLTAVPHDNPGNVGCQLQVIRF
ncbi:UNVERIFIED_CONTAM: putative B3 domain-containing protein [Sesamum radiatum]|uniref:B3 domain-containing protein n=1 Tax=Sesamum radiatum TaxID=300843 RepID=A0AAW2M508_SESRA